MTLVWVDFSERLGPQAEASVVESCSAALGRGQCAPAASSGERAEAPGEYRAQVTRVHDGVRYRIELLSSGRATATRLVDFAETDPLPQQWTALGLVVSSLVSSARAAESSVRREVPPVSPLPPPSRAVAPASAHRAAPLAPAEVSVAAGIVVGSGFGGSVDRFGFFGSGRLGRRGLAWGLGASLRYQFRPAEPSAEWQSFGLGVAYLAQLALVSLEVRPELVGERVHVTATQGELTQAATRWRTGARLQLTTTLELTDTWSLSGGASAEYLVPRVRWSVGGRELPTQEPLQVHGFLGLGLRWR